jgi:hypothetical protein
MQLQNPWVDRLLFGGPTSSQYLELDGGELSFNTGLKIATSSNIKFGDGNSEIYSFAGGTAFHTWTSEMSNILAITSSAFVFYPDTSGQVSGLSVLSGILGGIGFSTPSGISKCAWICGANTSGDQLSKVVVDHSLIQIRSCNPIDVEFSSLNTSPGSNYFDSQCTDSSSLIGQEPHFISIQVTNGGTQSIMSLENGVNTDKMSSFSLNVNDTLNGSNQIVVKSNDVQLNGVSGVDGQSIGIDGSGKLTWQSSGGGGYTGATVSINPQTGDYTLASGDEGGLISIDSVSAQTVYVPSDSVYNFETGSQFVITRANSGDVIIAPDGNGVVLNSAQGFLTLNYQYSAATLIKISSDNWYVFGDLKA